MPFVHCNAKAETATDGTGLEQSVGWLIRNFGPKSGGCERRMSISRGVAMYVQADTMARNVGTEA